MNGYEPSTKTFIKERNWKAQKMDNISKPVVMQLKTKQLSMTQLQRRIIDRH